MKSESDNKMTYLTPRFRNLCLSKVFLLTNYSQMHFNNKRSVNLRKHRKGVKKVSSGPIVDYPLHLVLFTTQGQFH